MAKKKRHRNSRIRLVHYLRHRFIHPLQIFVPLALFALSSKAGADSAQVYDIQLKWQPVQGVRLYKIQVSTTSDFLKIVEEGESSNASWDLHFKPDNSAVSQQIYYRIASIGESGQVGSYSPPQGIELPRMENRTEFQSSIRWTATLDAGLGGFKQTSSDANLKSVVSETLTFQQRATLQFYIQRSSKVVSPNGVTLEESLPEPIWSLRLFLSYATYSAVQDPRPFNQPNVSAYGYDFDFLRWNRSHSLLHWAYGLSFDRSYRWVKTGAESVESQGGLSGGPAAVLWWHTAHSALFSPQEVGVELGVPLTGVVTSDQAGLESKLWAEWGVFRSLRSQNGSFLGVRFEGDFNYFLWPTPAQTNLVSWIFWGSLAFHL